MQRITLFYRFIACILLVWVTAPGAWALTITFRDDFNGVKATLPDKTSKLYPNPDTWAFSLWQGVEWPESYGDGVNWLAGTGECQLYMTPFTTSVDKTSIPFAMRYDPFSIDPDGLHIKAGPLSRLQQSVYHISGFRRFGSGVLLSRFSFSYGRVRIVAKLPSARGSWPAFRLLPASHAPLPQVEILSAMPWGDHARQIHTGITTSTGEAGNFGKWIDANTDLTQDFHEYGFNWTPDKISVLFDGVTQWEQPTPPSMNQNMYLVIALPVGGVSPYDELGIKPKGSKDPERLAKGSDAIEADYPAEMIVRSVSVTPP